jgi:glycerol-3-phosphate dehydrogenase
LLQDPQPLAEEVDFLLRTAARVLTRPPKREDIRSAFAGLRPLVHPENDSGKKAPPPCRVNMPSWSATAA